MSAELQDTLYQALRAIYIIGLPPLIVLLLTSVLTSILQLALGVSEASVTFAARLLALIALLYVFTASAADTLVGLTQFAFR